VFDFPKAGGIDAWYDITTFRVRMYHTPGDFIRLAFEIIYVILLSYNIYIFVKKLVERNK